MDSNDRTHIIKDLNNKTVTIVREFNAPIEDVWRAWTESELLDQWWAPRPYVSKTKIMDFKVGGRRFYTMVSPEGQEHWSIQTFTSISPKTSFKMMSSFADKYENADLPGSEWYLSFNEQDGTTKVTVTIYNESLARMEKMLEMGFEGGFTSALGNLEELLATNV